MEWLGAVKKGLQKATLYVCAASMFLLIPLMLLTTTDVITRRAFNAPVPGVVEISSFMLAVIILLGIAYTHQVKGHPRVTLIRDRMPEKLQAVADIITTLLSLFIVAIIIWRGWVVATGDIGRIVSDVLRIPQLPFRMLVPIGGAFFFVELIIDLFTAIGKLFANELPSEQENGESQGSLS